MPEIGLPFDIDGLKTFIGNFSREHECQNPLLFLITGNQVEVASLIGAPSHICLAAELAEKQPDSYVLFFEGRSGSGATLEEWESFRSREIVSQPENTEVLIMGASERGGSYRMEIAEISLHPNPEAQQRGKRQVGEWFVPAKFFGRLLITDW